MTLEEQLRRDEGYRQFAYRDTMGFLTIGIGRNLDQVGIFEDEAVYMLRNDIERVRHRLEKDFPWYQALDPVRRAVIENMTFNMGHASFSKFRETLKAIEKREYHMASQHMLDSLWAKQVGPRSARLAQQMVSGEWV